MKLRKFISNSQEITEDISVEDKLSGPTVKFLGIKWCSLADEFQITLPNNTDLSNPTKCDILFYCLHF